MPTDLHIPLQRRGTLHHVLPGEKGIGTVLGSDLQHGGLNLAFPLQSIVVGEKVELDDAVIGGDVVGAEPQPSVEKLVVGLRIEGGNKCL